MRRDQLEHAIRAACQIIDQEAVIVVGSQAILGSIPERELPAAAEELSRPVDRRLMRRERHLLIGGVVRRVCRS
jgi:predicted NBD/HSP70 family sugar kinase